MPVPVAYQKLQDDLNKKAAEESRVAEQMRKWREEEETGYFRTILRALVPYHKADVETYKTSIKSRPTKREVDLLLDGQPWWTFSVERGYSSCYCEGPCSCRQKTWVGARCIFHLPGEESYKSYFNHDDWSDDAVAKGIMEALKHRREAVEHARWRKERGNAK